MFERKTQLAALGVSLVIFLINLETSICSPNDTNTTVLNTLLQFTDKLVTKFHSQMLSSNSKNRIKGRSAHDYGYLESFSHDIYGKSDYSWLIPLIVVIGFGTLLIPLMGTLMTTMVTQGTINLTAGRRRKRSINNDDAYKQFSLPSFGDLQNILKNVDSAINKFSKHFNQ